MSYDPKVSLQHWPTPMAKYGLNPYGENLYRIVFAPSRRRLVYGTWPNGERKASWVTAYPEVGRIWIMERWQTPFEFARCTAEVWNQTMTLLGPYPDRGEYEICHPFEITLPTDCNLDKIVMWVEEGRNRSWWENRTACQADYDKEEKSNDSTKNAIIRNSLPAFGTAPMSGFGGGRGTKTAPILKTAEELGLPTSGGMSRARQTNQQYEVMVQL